MLRQTHGAFRVYKSTGRGDLNKHKPDVFRFYKRTKTVTYHRPSVIRQSG